MKRVAYVCADPGIPVFGTKGGSVHVQEVVRGFLARGAEVHVFAARVGGSPPDGLEGVVLHEVTTASRGLPSGERERALLAANPVLAARLDEAGPFDLVYERHALWSFAAMEWARSHDIPALLEVNAPLVEEQGRYRTLVDRAGAEESAARAFAAADALLAVSQGVASLLVGSGTPVHVVPNGVDPERFRPATAMQAPSDVFTVGFVGGLRPWHGVEGLVEGFARVSGPGPEPRLVLVGDGPARTAVERRVSELGLERRVTFTGQVDPSDVPDLVLTFDAAVAPYPLSDDAFYFSPLKLFEYMAAGRAIVAPALGQIADVLEHERTALLYAPEAEDGLSRCLQRLRGDADLRARLGAAARADAVRRHTWTAVVDRILSLAGERRATAPTREAG